MKKTVHTPVFIDMKATKMSIDRGMDKENVVYIQLNIT